MESPAAASKERFRILLLAGEIPPALAGDVDDRLAIGSAASLDAAIADAAEEPDPDLVVIGADLDGPTAIGRQAIDRWPAARLFFLGSADRLQRLRGTLPFVPRLEGASVAPADCGREELVSLLLQAAAGGRQRESLRSMMRSVNERLRRADDADERRAPGLHQLSHHYFSALVANAMDGFLALDRDGRILAMNPAAENLLRGRADGAIQTLGHALKDGERDVLERLLADAAAGKSSGLHDLQLTRRGGKRPCCIEISLAPVMAEKGRIEAIAATIRDVTERRVGDRRRAALVELSDRIRDLADPADLAFAAAEILGKTLEVSRAGYGTIDPAAETITIERDWSAPGVASLAGTLRFRDYGSYIEDLKRGETVVFGDAEKDPRTSVRAAALKAIDAQSVVNMPIVEDGGTAALLYLNHAEPRDWSEEELGFIREVAERTRMAVQRRRAEQELRRLAGSLEQQVEERTAELMRAEEALRQSQKMEAVGQLTGGIAHDFNNLLTIIIGNLDAARRHLGEDGSPRAVRAVTSALTGAQRASTLTQRLLAFSRRQPLSPKRISPNQLVTSMSDLLHRTLGEVVELETVLSPSLWQVEVDPNQLENALLNLAVNARDAMPEGGKLTIETANVNLDRHYVARNVEVVAGQYVAICVSDTGTGMDADTVSRAVEPFFTTKDVGKGTGLGLSMVFGFVKQSDGHLKIYSEPRHGTTVKIYLPRIHGDGSEEEKEEKELIPDGSREETILVCEDDDDVRAYTVEVLRELGYRVLEAHDGPSALRLLERQEGRVDLLFTDVVLPSGLTGADVARQAKEIRPDLKILFTTGYARDAITHHGRLDPGVELIPKPFAYAELASRVRDILDKTKL